MIDSTHATIVIVSFLVFFGVVIPICDKIQRIKEFVSFRWTIIVIFSSMALGVLIDFSHLNDDIRIATIIGALILAGIFLTVRSVEKLAAKGWNLPKITGSVKYRDAKAEIVIEDSDNGTG